MIISIVAILQKGISNSCSITNGHNDILRAIYQCVVFSRSTQSIQDHVECCHFRLSDTKASTKGLLDTVMNIDKNDTLANERVFI